jgi:hypothetical protein
MQVPRRLLFNEKDIDRIREVLEAPRDKPQK